MEILYKEKLPNLLCTLIDSVKHLHVQALIVCDNVMEYVYQTL